MASDPLSDILDLLGARCMLSGALSADGRWVRHFPRPNVIKVMAMVEGSCWLTMEDIAAPLRLEPGDVVLVNGRHAMTMSSDLRAAKDVDNTATLTVTPHLRQIGTHRDTYILGGHVALDPNRQGLLLDVLPPVIHISGASEEAGVLRWLLNQLAREWDAQRPGAATAAGQLAQLIFVQALRAHLETEGLLAGGWLKALADERIAPALGLIHADPAKAWTLAELAKAVGMSRTSFALRFKAVVGVAPLAYLTQWRMHLAERDLRQSDVPVSSLAFRLGYTSESAFSNAFKRVTGVAPRRYRSAGKDDPAPVADGATVDAF
jgi:AraC-like DNA-binding protein